jgi:hypothetical protein
MPVDGVDDLPLVDKNVVYWIAPLGARSGGAGTK